MSEIRFGKLLVLVNGSVPAGLLAWDWTHGQAGVNPVNYAIRTTGILTLIFLCLSLLVTPLRRVTGWSWLFHFRRLLGLYAFFHALAHFSIFFVLERGMSVSGTLSEMVTRKYLIVGSLGLLVMVPLAATSTNAMIRRMGPARWRALHKLAYVAAIAGVVHFYMLVKSDVRLPVAYAVVVGILLGYRAVAYLVDVLKTPVSMAVAQAADKASDGSLWNGPLRVERITQETHDVRTFRMVSPGGGELPFEHLPGQYLTFNLPLGDRTVRRSYTIASAPTQRGYCEVTIKRDGAGLVSRHMHDAVKEGDMLTVAAASGRFTFTGAEAGSVALVAGGVGITPLMAILRHLTDMNWGGRIHLVYANKTEGDIIFRQEIAGLQKRFANLSLTLTLTRAEGSGWGGAVGRIDAALISRVIPDVKSVPFFLCGPGEMIKATRGALAELGVPEGNIHTESFGWRPTAGEDAVAGTFAVTFARSGKVGRISGGGPLLALADELGVRVDSECRSGICGRCKTRLVSGSVKMESEEALRAEDRRENVVLLCQARALEDVVLEA